MYSLFVFLLSQILNKEKINRNLQDFQSVTKIPHNKKKKNTLKTIICGLEYVRLHSKSCALSRQPQCFQRFILEARVPVSSSWHSFHSVTTTAQQVVFADKSSSSMQTAGNYVNLAPVKPIARFLLQHIFP